MLIFQEISQHPKKLINSKNFPISKLFNKKSPKKVIKSCIKKLLPCKFNPIKRTWNSKEFSITKKRKKNCIEILNYKLSFITIWKSFFLSFALINLNLKFKFCRPFVMTKNQSFFRECSRFLGFLGWNLVIWIIRWILRNAIAGYYK